MERRDFVAAGVAAGLARWGPGASPRGQPSRAPTVDRPMVGIQVGAVSFVDEGTDRVLDGFEQMAGINTLFVATFTYGRGIAGRQLRGQPLPDHGRQEYDDGFRGGNFVTQHPKFYRCTAIEPENAPDHAAYALLAELRLAASDGGGGSDIGCFCPHCLDAARQTGIDIARARKGYLALEGWAAALRGGQRPADGAFVTFWRLLVKYPELLAWERLWNEGLN